LTALPVNLRASFRKAIDVISAGCDSKSTLRAIAVEFTARPENV